MNAIQWFIIDLKTAMKRFFPSFYQYYLDRRYSHQTYDLNEYKKPMIMKRKYGITMKLDNNEPHDIDVYKRWLKDHDGETDLELLMHKKLSAGDTFVDIGANEGYYTLLASKLVGESGRVYAFEPAKKAYGRLVENLKLNKCNNVTVFNIGLGSKSGSADLNISSVEDGQNSLVTAERSASTEKIEIKPIDELKLGNVKMVKIDVEGYEREVIEGGRGFFTKVKPLVNFEFNYSILRQKTSNFNETFDALRSCGYNNFIELETGKRLASYRGISKLLTDMMAYADQPANQR